ncbi:hypothetical protein HY524_01100 [Candidatus Berkelbacteria bacterium]|nr:hypothetical protein [Candidatus Berkelbacteria bacterium]
MFALHPQIESAIRWLQADRDTNGLPADVYCSSRDIFQARLDSLRLQLEERSAAMTEPSLVVAVLGELGNNAFDHNLGTWRDSPGVYFAHDRAQGLAVIADRGQGVLASLRRVLPALPTDQVAVDTAFTQTISGRSPERRGNGLKFVVAVAAQSDLTVDFYSGSGVYHCGDHPLELALTQPVQGVLAVVRFNPGGPDAT